MRLTRFIVVCGMALLVTGQGLFAQSKQEVKDAQVKRAVDSGRFTIEVNRAIPMSGRAMNLASSYSLELRGDSVVSRLPYYGRAYSVPYGGGDGLVFKEQVSDFKQVQKKKGQSVFTFRVRTKDDVYAFRVEVFPGGSSTISVTPVNKQGITFYGEVSPEVGM